MCCAVFQNGSTALHAAVMGGNVRTVLLLLGANADPTLHNQVKHFSFKHEKEKRERKAERHDFSPFPLQNNELAADLTKNARILKILCSNILTGDS